MEQSAKHAAHQQRLMQDWGSYAYQVTVQASVYLLSLSLILYIFSLIMSCALIKMELHRQMSTLHRPSLNQIDSQPSIV